MPAFARAKCHLDESIAITDARNDVELFGHAFALDHLTDGIVHHIGAASVVRASAEEVGHAPEDGDKVKRKRYPTRFGKAILRCSMETWGFLGTSLEALLEELVGLAGRKQRGRGMVPTKWLLKWRGNCSAFKPRDH